MISIEEINKLKAENDKLKKEVLSQNDYILQLSADSEKLKWREDDIKKLQEENARLKEEIEKNKAVYQSELGVYNMECGTLLEENERYYQFYCNLKKRQCEVKRRNKRSQKVSI